VKPPVAVAPPEKHGLDVVKFRFVIFRLPPLVSLMLRLKLKTGLLLLELINAAVQFPLMELSCELEPQAASSRAIPRTSIVPMCFIGSPRFAEE
jgi:hypothetical protein